MDEHGIQILLRVDRELALQRFLSDYLLPCLAERGYSLRNLLQALGSAAFDNNEKVAHYLWDAVANLDTIQLAGGAA